jgi:hypothetical protein
LAAGETGRTEDDQVERFGGHGRALRSGWRSLAQPFVCA